MSFKLFEELGKLDTKGIVLLVLGAIAVAALFAALARSSRRVKNAAPERELNGGAGKKKPNVRALVYGALCVSLSFVLSYFKLFELPMGGSVTLLSMLPVTAYAMAFGPAYGFTAAFAYSLLQVVQGAYVVHWAQFLLDYIFAFTCLGIASLFPKSLPLGIAVAGLGRFACSVLSGVIFFSSYAADAGFQSAWLYSIAYNGSSLGLDAFLCVLAAFLPAVRRLLDRMKA
ncbi:MAG: energy-coupled thiamine transporter ThiT [Eubacteriales bacterium]|nr:energy-coupled thiamine transporter ThiT [Eubacteriales bacterium]